MEQRDIELFLTLVDELHFGRAAERLHVSTARVSQTIKKLERRIGAPLFERTSRRVGLTAIGRRLADDLRPAHDQIRDAVARATTAARDVRTPLRVGFIGAASGRFVMEVVEVFGAGHPGCDVSVRENQFGEGLGPLRAGEVDMVLATLPARGVRPDGTTAGSVLVEEQQFLAVSTRHPFARRTSVAFAEVGGTRILSTPPSVPDWWDRVLVPAHAPDSGPVERGPSFDTTQEMLALVGAGVGTYPVSAQFTSHYVQPGVAYVPIRDAAPYQRRFHWLTAGETATIRAFDETAAVLSGAG